MIVPTFQHRSKTKRDSINKQTTQSYLLVDHRKRPLESITPLSKEIQSRLLQVDCIANI